MGADLALFFPSSQHGTPLYLVPQFVISLTCLVLIAARSTLMFLNGFFDKIAADEKQSFSKSAIYLSLSLNHFNKFEKIFF